MHDKVRCLLRSQTREMLLLYSCKETDERDPTLEFPVRLSDKAAFIEGLRGVMNRFIKGPLLYKVRHPCLI